MASSFHRVINKTAGGNRHIFRHLNLLQILLRRMKAFSRKNAIYFFPKLFFFDFCKKPSIQLQKSHIYEIISFDTHSTANLSPSTISGKNSSFFQKQTFFFQKEKEFKPPTYLRNLSISIALCSNRQVCYKFVMKIFQFQNCTNILIRTFSLNLRKTHAFSEGFSVLLKIINNKEYPTTQLIFAFSKSFEMILFELADKCFSMTRTFLINSSITASTQLQIS